MAPNNYTISSKSQEALVKMAVATFNASCNDLHGLRTKMGVIDIMYARYQYEAARTDESEAYKKCSAEFKELENNFVSVNIPLLVSQVDTAVGYLAELYLSGSPIFPVVSDPSFRKTAEYIETLVDNYSRMGSYPRQFLMFFKDCVKYNIAPIHLGWDVVPAWDYHLDNTNMDNAGEFKVRREYHGYMAIDRLDPYNVIFDTTVSPGSVSEEGEFAGWVEHYTPSRLAKLIDKLKNKAVGYLVNQSKVFDKDQGQAEVFYHAPPEVSKYVQIQRDKSLVDYDWSGYFEEASQNKKRKERYKGLYEVQTLYRRINPADYGLASPETKGMDKNEFRIYKLIVINGNTLLYVEPMYTPYDHLPILIGHPNEDGLKLQTQSTAEGTIPMQNAVTALTNIRFHAARRAISDRALYDSTAITTTAINNPNPSGKIPVVTNSLTRGKLSDLYYSIPYDPRGTDQVINDAMLIAEWTNSLNGLNRAQQGQFQKGNKTREEFSTIMSNAEMRQRLPAIMIEFQVFAVIKQFLKMNISRFSEAHKIRSAVSGKELEMDINQLRNVVYDFKIADGYAPSSKLASTDLITAGMQLIGASEPLQLAYGGHLANMFAHMMALGGVKGLDNYAQQPEAAPTGEQNAGATEPQAGVPGMAAGGQ